MSTKELEEAQERHEKRGFRIYNAFESQKIKKEILDMFNSHRERHYDEMYKGEIDFSQAIKEEVMMLKDIIQYHEAWLKRRENLEAKEKSNP